MSKQESEEIAQINKQIANFKKEGKPNNEIIDILSNSITDQYIAKLTNQSEELLKGKYDAVYDAFKDFNENIAKPMGLKVKEPQVTTGKNMKIAQSAYDITNPTDKDLTTLSNAYKGLAQKILEKELKPVVESHGTSRFTQVIKDFFQKVKDIFKSKEELAKITAAKEGKGVKKMTWVEKVAPDRADLNISKIIGDKKPTDKSAHFEDKLAKQRTQELLNSQRKQK